jgi:hypothetical protein
MDEGIIGEDIFSCAWEGEAKRTRSGKELRKKERDRNYFKYLVGIGLPILVSTISRTQFTYLGLAVASISDLVWGTRL